MDRRHFAKLTGAFPFLYDSQLGTAQTPIFTSPKTAEWPDKIFRRYSVDMHVPDWSPELLSRFDAATFIGLIAEGGAQSMMMANSHTGLCVWRTKIGRMHANRNISQPFCLEVETHPSVEATLFHQPERRCLLAGLLNLEREFPQIEVGASVRVKLPPHARAREILRLPGQTRIAFRQEQGYASFRLEPFEAIAMAQVFYE